MVVLSRDAHIQSITYIYIYIARKLPTKLMVTISSVYIPLIIYIHPPQCLLLYIYILYIYIIYIASLSLSQEFACNGTVVDHPEYGEVIQLSGDQRKNIYDFLLKIQLARKEQLKLHGF